MVDFFCTKSMANDDSLDALIPKIPFSFPTEFWVRVTPGVQGSVPVGFWEVVD